MAHRLPRRRPSDLRVDPRGITALIEALEAADGVEPHSIMLLRSGSVLAEGWWTPYAADRPHLLYSLSKSFTSTAVGIAVDEGILSLDDTVISHFPEFDAEITDERTRSMRVRHLLAMASGHREETIDRALSADPDDLVHGFLLTPPDEEPGSVFAYNQPCTFTLAAIIQRLTRGTLVDYLRPRLLDPLGIGEVGWLTDRAGRQLGFSGLFAETEAIALLGQLYLQRGEWEGQQLVSSEWVDEATRAHVSNAGEANPDWSQGYGFQFWMARHGYRGDGAYGQFCVVLPELEVVLALTGQSVDMQRVLDLTWRHLLPAIDPEGGASGGDLDGERGGIDDATADADLIAALAGLALPPVPYGENIPSFAGQESAGQEFTAGPDSQLARLRTIRVAAAADSDDRTLVLQQDGVDGSLTVTAGIGRWTVDGATAASIGGIVESEPSTPTGPGSAPSQLLVEVILLETPHRFAIVLDLAASTFTAIWRTQPLHDLPLGELRMPV